MTDQRDFSNADLLRYFTGDDRLSPEKEARIGEWVQSRTASWGAFLGGRDEDASAEWDTEAELRKLEAKIDRKSDTEEREAASPERTRRARPTRKSTRSKRVEASTLFRAGAVVVLMAVSALLAVTFWGAGDGGGETAIVREVATDRGQRAQVRLADGTQVTLSVDSKLRIPDDLDELNGARDVYLEGEAYFNVVSNPDRPFRVHAGGSVTRVLGTQFSVRAYPDEEEARVVVAEGSVAVQADREAVGEAVSLTPRQMVQWSQRGPETIQVAQNVDVDRYLGWREGELVFSGTPLREVVAQMERWYDIEVQLADSSLAGRTFTGSFRDTTPVQQVFDTFSFASGLRYQKDGRTVVLHSSQE